MKSKFLVLTLTVAIVAFFAATANAALFTIDELTDSVLLNNILVEGNDNPAGTGLHYEVVKFKPHGNGTSGKAYDGSAHAGGFDADQAPHGDVDVGDLWGALNDAGITSTQKLVFAFDANQNSQDDAALDYIIISSLVINIDGKEFSLGDNQVKVAEHLGNGSSTSEAKFTVDFGEDFMAKYDAASIANFQMDVGVTNANAGFDEFFLTLTASDIPPVPEPASLMILGMGLVGMFLKRKM